MFELLLFILVIATIILIILYTLSGPSAKPPPESGTSAKNTSSPEKASSRSRTPKIMKRKQSPTQPKKDSLSCPYGFGHLSKRDKNTPIPDECLSCPKMLECSSSSER